MSQRLANGLFRVHRQDSSSCTCNLIPSRKKIGSPNWHEKWGKLSSFLILPLIWSESPMLSLFLFMMRQLGSSTVFISCLGLTMLSVPQESTIWPL